ncbi:MAG: hypothetical protein FIA99_09580 [Ruminiclostridium sp.]|nr:hypothetical protein [Ruminiclostridium sp.]
MNSYERVKAALEHREPDCLPFDIGSTGVTGINYKTYCGVLDLLHIENEDVQFASVITQLAKVSEKARQTLGIDTEESEPAPLPGSVICSDDDACLYITDEFGIKWRMPKIRGLYYDMCEHPLYDTDTVNDLKKYRFPDTEDIRLYRNMTIQSEHITKLRERACVLGRNCGGIFEMALFLRGFENFLCDLVLNQGFAGYLLDLITDYKIAYWEKALEFDKGNSLVISEADDFATQNGLLISKDIYRKFIKPCHKKLFEKIREKTHGKVYIFLHSCGAVSELIPDLIESGVDILNPVQVSACGMDLAKLKKEFGKDLTFWGGGIDTQHVLPYGSRKQVEDNVKRHIDELAPGGGFIFSAVHNIQGDVPPENVISMWETFQKYKKY